MTHGLTLSRSGITTLSAIPTIVVRLAALTLALNRNLILRIVAPRPLPSRSLGSHAVVARCLVFQTAGILSNAKMLSVTYLSIVYWSQSHLPFKIFKFLKSVPIHILQVCASKSDTSLSCRVYPLPGWLLGPFGANYGRMDPGWWHPYRRRRCPEGTTIVLRYFPPTLQTRVVLPQPFPAMNTLGPRNRQ